MKNIFLTTASALLLLASCQKQMSPVPEELPAQQDQALTINTPAGGNFDAVPNELIVKFKKGIPEHAKGNAFGRVKGKVKEKIRTKLMERFNEDEIYLITTSENAKDALAKIKGAEIEYAEPNYIMRHNAVANDPYISNAAMWGLSNSTYGINAQTAWANNKLGSSNVIIGVIDEGTFIYHPDIQPNVWTHPTERFDGIDNDGNGYIDDVYGWDFSQNDNTVYDGPEDDHGTHVAGTIGAMGNNSVGVAGVNWRVTMIPVKFLGANGGSLSNAIKAIDYITDLKLRLKVNIPATNNSWSGGGYSQALRDAITRAGNANILFVAAAGNASNNNDATPTYPASYANANVISVAAITSTGALASFSNYGSRTVHIGAPGANILSTVPTSTGGAGYASYNGTSMATPHVTGAVALYVSTRPGLSAAQIKSAILNNGVYTASLSGKTTTAKRLNVSKF